MNAGSPACFSFQTVRLLFLFSQKYHTIIKAVTVVNTKDGENPMSSTKGKSSSGRGKKRRKNKAGYAIFVLPVYMELVFHLYMGLDMKYTPIFLLSAVSVGMIMTGILSLLPKRAVKAAGTAAVLLLCVVYTGECICKHILQQYYQIIGGLDTAAGNHLGDYSDAVIDAVAERWPGILLLFVLPLACWLWAASGSEKTSGRPKRRDRRGRRRRLQQKKAAVCLGAAAVFHMIMLAVIFWLPWKGDFTPARLYRIDTYTDDQVEQLGLLTMLRLDVKHSIFGVKKELIPVVEQQIPQEEPEEEKVYPYNALDIDFEALEASAANENEAWLSEYFNTVTPTRQNEYTGMFEGYNVIFLTAEGFSGYMIDPELTPTLYRLTHEGFVFNNFYSALHFTSTSGGEFQNLTGLYPKAGFPVSMKETGVQGTDLPFTLAGRLNEKGYTSIGYHFNQNMYGRELSHPNLGYDWRQATECSRPIELEKNENGDAYWPQSDDYMVSATFDEYVSQEPFNIYYLTISGHLPYGFGSNMMSVRNQEQTAELPYSEKTKAYIAAGLELEKGLSRLVESLEEAGIADHTVIVMAPDHIPYSDLDIIEELAGRSFGSDSLESLDEQNLDIDIYRNSWILWSASMEEPVEVNKVCSQVDILPTLLNLLGVEYDSRMFSGTDVLSDTDTLVVFFSNSWLTDKGQYDRYTGTFRPAEGIVMSEDEQNVYVENMKYLASCRLKLAELIIENDYYAKATAAYSSQ